MATLSSGRLTLNDWAKRLDPSGKTSTIVELLSQSNQIIDNILWQEGNLPTGMLVTVRTGLPTAYWRLVNYGTPPSKSRTAQVTEMCGILEARSECDIMLAKLSSDVGAFRLKEARAFVSAINNEMAQTIFYGNSGTAPEEFNGLSVRYSSLSAENGTNIIPAGGSGSDNSSIWLVGWGEGKVSGIFPKGTKAGLEHEDLGIGDAFDASNNRYRAYMDRWQWNCGITVEDWRYAVRIPNIDISNLVAKSSAADLIELMIKAIHRLESLNDCSPVFYMNRTCFQMLDIQKRDDVIAGAGLRYDNVDGVPQFTFRGIPVKRCDALLETEAVVS